MSFLSSKESYLPKVILHHKIAYRDMKWSPTIRFNLQMTFLLKQFFGLRRLTAELLALTVLLCQMSLLEDASGFKTP